jgi:uncharacterized coiled-coil DUF342 family protein
MWPGVLKFLGWLFAQRKDAVDGYESLTGDMRKWQLMVQAELKECAQDRVELRTEIRLLKDKVETCEEERDDLSSRVANLENKTP